MSRSLGDTGGPVKSSGILVFSECVAKGSRLTLEVWRLESCSPSVARTTVHDRSMFSMRSLSVTIGRRSQNLTKCDQDDVLDADILAHSVFLFSFCDMRGISWR